MQHDDFINTHSQQLGELRSDVNTLKEGQHVLFGKIDNLDDRLDKLALAAGGQAKSLQHVRYITNSILTTIIALTIGMVFNYFTTVESVEKHERPQRQPVPARSSDSLGLRR